MPRGVRYGNSCGAVAHKFLTLFAQTKAIIDIPAQIPSGYIHDGLPFTKQNTPVPGLPAWRLVIWGLTNFHIGPHVPLRIVMVNVFAKELLKRHTDFIRLPWWYS